MRVPGTASNGLIETARNAPLGPRFPRTGLGLGSEISRAGVRARVRSSRVRSGLSLESHQKGYIRVRVCNIRGKVRDRCGRVRVRRLLPTRRARVGQG